MQIRVDKNEIPGGLFHHGGLKLVWEACEAELTKVKGKHGASGGNQPTKGATNKVKKPATFRHLPKVEVGRIPGSRVRFPEVRGDPQPPTGEQRGTLRGPVRPPVVPGKTPGKTQGGRSPPPPPPPPSGSRKQKKEAECAFPAPERAGRAPSPARRPARAQGLGLPGRACTGPRESLTPAPTSLTQPERRRQHRPPPAPAVRGCHRRRGSRGRCRRPGAAAAVAAAAAAAPLGLGPRDAGSLSAQGSGPPRRRRPRAEAPPRGAPRSRPPRPPASPQPPPQPRPRRPQVRGHWPCGRPLQDAIGQLARPSPPSLERAPHSGSHPTPQPCPEAAGQGGRLPAWLSARRSRPLRGPSPWVPFILPVSRGSSPPLQLFLVSPCLS